MNKARILKTFIVTVPNRPPFAESGLSSSPQENEKYSVNIRVLIR